MLDFTKIRTIPIRQRRNKLKLNEIIKPENNNIEPLNSNNFNELIERIKKAIDENKHIILMIGAHVIKTGMSLLIIDLMKKGIIRHIAMNGAGPIHDFEI